jgi:hypothetical protein
MQTGSILKVDYRNLISRADVTYDTPVARSEAGLPVGNGSVGSLVWTTPTAVRFQINRVDVFGNNAASNNFFERNTDYSGGTGFVDVDFVDYGKPVFSGSNDNESVWGGHNTVEEMSAMYGLLPVAIRAAEILGIDVELRSAWEEFLDNLAPLPVSSDYPELAQAAGPVTWVRSLQPIVQGPASRRPDPNTMPVWFFDLCNLESDDSRMLEIANATYNAYFRDGINKGSRIFVLSKLSTAGAILAMSKPRVT